MDVKAVSPLKFENDELTDVAHGYHQDFRNISSEVVDQRRWVTVYERVVEYIPSGAFYILTYEVASTETCEGSESEEVHIVEAVEKERVQKYYEAI